MATFPQSMQQFAYLVGKSIHDGAPASAPVTEEKLNKIISLLEQKPALAQTTNINLPTKITYQKAKINKPLIAMNSNTGENVTGKDLTAEMLKYALTTGKRQLLMRRELGCDLNLVRGKNQDETTIFIMYALIAETVKIIADRFTLLKIELITQTQSSITFAIVGTDNSRFEVML